MLERFLLKTAIKDVSLSLIVKIYAYLVKFVKVFELKKSLFLSSSFCVFLNFSPEFLIFEVIIPGGFFRSIKRMIICFKNACLSLAVLLLLLFLNFYKNILFNQFFITYHILFQNINPLFLSGW